MIVIADDITGAAEIAGIAFSRGRQVQFVCGPPAGCGAVAAITVIATDTRSMTEADAIAETKRIASLLTSRLVRGGSGGRTFSPFLFKKTDSALRGHVVAELHALMRATGHGRAVYLPANPSKGRIIRAGTYYVNDTPIADTDFSFDPEFPAWTSVLKERFPDAGCGNILMPDAESAEDMRRVVATRDDGHTLFAGAADLFEVLLAARTSGDARALGRTNAVAWLLPSLGCGPALIVCGSTQSRTPDIGMVTAPMPRELYEGSTDITLWDTKGYSSSRGIILTIPYHHRTGKDCAEHLRAVTAKKVKSMVRQLPPSHLIIEGGATAWAILHALGLTVFEVVCQIAPGVVQLCSESGIRVTLKPGSYPWPALQITRNN